MVLKTGITKGKLNIDMHEILNPFLRCDRNILKKIYSNNQQLNVSIHEKWYFSFHYLLSQRHSYFNFEADLKNTQTYQNSKRSNQIILGFKI